MLLVFTSAVRIVDNNNNNNNALFQIQKAVFDIRGRKTHTTIHENVENLTNDRPYILDFLFNGIRGR